MAGFIERVQVFIDVVADKGASTLNDLKSKVSEAEGGFGKLKAAGAGVFDLAAASAPLALAGVGTAVATFALKGVEDFEKLAASAKTFSVVAGTSVQDASRWIETANDLGVSSDDVGKAMARLNREASLGKLAEFGISASNANDRLIQTLQYLSTIPDAAHRSQVAFELFGKGAQAIAPLIANVATLRDRLAEVKGGQLIDDQDVSSARALADNMDELSDHWKQLELSVGKTVAPMVSLLAQAAEKMAALTSVAFVQAPKGGSWWDTIDSAASNLAISLTTAIPGLQGLSDMMSSTGGNAKAMGGDIDAASQELATQAQAAQEAEQALTAYDNAVLAEFNSELKFADAVGRTSAKIDDYNAKLAVATAATGGDTAANEAATNAMNAAAQAALAQAAATLQVAQDQATANGTTLSAGTANEILRASLQQVANTLGAGSPLRTQLEGYIAKLNQIPSEKTTDVNVNTADAMSRIAALVRAINNIPTMVGNPLLVSGSGTHSASGRLVTSPMFSTLGESGPEVVLNEKQATKVLWSLANGVGAGIEGPVTGGTPAVRESPIDTSTYGVPADPYSAIFKPGRMAGLAPGAGGPNVTVNVNVAGSLVGTDRAQVGEWVVKGVQAFEAANGKLWRS